MRVRIIKKVYINFNYHNFLIKCLFIFHNSLIQNNFLLIMCIPGAEFQGESISLIGTQLSLKMTEIQWSQSSHDKKQNSHDKKQNSHDKKQNSQEITWKVRIIKKVYINFNYHNFLIKCLFIFHNSLIQKDFLLIMCVPGAEFQGKSIFLIRTQLSLKMTEIRWY